MFGVRFPVTELAAGNLPLWHSLTLPVSNAQ